MRLFDHEIFWGNGAYSGVFGEEIKKRLEFALGCTSGLQQAGCGPDPICDEHVKLMEKELEDAVRDIVMACMNCEVTFHPRREWNAPHGDNMPGWEAVLVDLANNTITGRHVQSLGRGYGRAYVVLLPSSLIGNADVARSLLAPKPKGFCPDADKGSREHAIHMKVCYDNQLCIQCGMHDYDDTAEEFMYPYCKVHDPYGKYYPQWWDGLEKK